VSDLTAFQTRLGYTFKNLDLLRLALTHPSVAHELGGQVEPNQRLEFLGDAVLGLILSADLYERFPKFDEGPLTKARAQMVNRLSLAQLARKIELGPELFLGKGEDQNGGRERNSALADAFEAVIGAIFLDGGYGAARDVVLGFFADLLGNSGEIPNLENPKGELQEKLQARSPEAPQYRLDSVSGPDHDRVFECTVTHEGRELGRGRGKSKKEAESEAALAALLVLKSIAGS
jgi:ribonuclease-3